MSGFSRPRASLVLGLSISLSGQVLAEATTPPAEDPAGELAPVTVTATGLADTTEGSGSYAAGRNATATGLAMTAKETPQSTSVVTRTEMEDFGYTDVNDVLASTTGVRVEKVETDRTYYTARGFDIQNFQMDGQGVPFTYGNVVGDLDTVIYDRVEVLRGSNGLMSGTGTPSATVNFVRKRPTDALQSQLDVTVGSWDRRRIDADVSNRLNDSGTVRGRFVTGYEAGNSWLQRYSQEKSVHYGVVEMDLTDATTLALGASFQNNNSSSPLWGALPLYYTDGTPTDYDVSTSTSADWAYWNGEFTNVFAELTHALGSDWQAVAAVNYRETLSDGKLFYVYGTPDKSTPESDLFAYPSRYELDNDQLVADLRIHGPFEWFGREHQAIFGASYWESELQDRSDYGAGIGTPIPPLELFDGNYPEPAFDAAVNGSQFTDRQKSVYAATRLKLLDALAFVGGARVISLSSRGTTYGTSTDTEYSAEVVPYYSLVYDLNATHALYASYAEIFDPQTELDINGDRLDPIVGETREVGLKSAFFADTLQTTLAVFETEQDNLAGNPQGTPPNEYYEETDGIRSRGYEVDVRGELLPGWQVAGGFTQVNISNPDDSRARPYTPERFWNLSTTWQVPQVERLKVGGSVRWQDTIRTENGLREQASYTLLDLMARYQLSPAVSAQLNVRNVTDEKYLNSLYWNQGYYGEPRAASVKISWQY